MNKQELTTIIRTIVREEVEKSLPSVLVEILASKVNKPTTITERKASAPSVQPQSVVRRKPLVSFEGGQPPAMERPQQKFSSNPVLNQILNETRGGIPDETEDMGQASILETLDSLPQTAEVQGVANALTKDYRSLLKAMDKKR